MTVEIADGLAAPVARSLPSPRPSGAIPRRGHVLTTVAEEYGRPVREAVAILTHALRRKDSAEVYHSCISRRIPEPGAWIVRPDAEMLAWTLVSAWLTGFTTQTISGDDGLRDAAHWFFGNALESNPATLIPERGLIQADEALSACEDLTGYLELLPYVLDPHGPGSRLSIRRDARTRAARDKKRAEGVYYTPPDVAAYMARKCLEGFADNHGPLAFFDPACGTAVFLRAALAALKEVWPDHSTQSLAQTRLYGTDIDPWALDAAAFVLLADCLIDSADSYAAPLPLWHRLRLNLACVDALRLDPPYRAIPPTSESERRILDSLAAGQLPTSDETAPFNDRVYPDATRGGVEVRPCVYSTVNKNYKIEISAAKSHAYPDDGRPLLVFRERQLRTYDYMLLMPGEDGYGRLLDLSNRLPSPGKGFPRPITDMANLAQAWPDCPLLHTPEAEEQGI